MENNRVKPRGAAPAAREAAGSILEFNNRVLAGGGDVREAVEANLEFADCSSNSLALYSG